MPFWSVCVNPPLCPVVISVVLPTTAVSMTFWFVFLIVNVAAPVATVIVLPLSVASVPLAGLVPVVRAYWVLLRFAGRSSATA